MPEPPKPSGPVPSRLADVETCEIRVQAAHGTRGDLATERALAELFEQYRQPVYAYLLGAVRDEDLANELLQEFALSLVRGDFRQFDPAKGRFRFYLKSILANLVRRFQARRLENQSSRRLRVADMAAAPDSSSDDEFDRHWIAALLARSSQQLAARADRAAVLLQLRATHPEASIAELAALFSTAINSPLPLRAEAVRKALQRAREDFAEILAGEVKKSLGDACGPDQLFDEVVALGLYEYVKDTAVCSAERPDREI